MNIQQMTSSNVVVLTKDNGESIVFRGKLVLSYGDLSLFTTEDKEIVVYEVSQDTPRHFAVFSTIEEASTYIEEKMASRHEPDFLLSEIKKSLNTYSLANGVSTPCLPRYQENKLVACGNEDLSRGVSGYTVLLELGGIAYTGERIEEVSGNHNDSNIPDGQYNVSIPNSDETVLNGVSYVVDEQTRKWHRQ